MMDPQENAPAGQIPDGHPLVTNICGECGGELSYDETDDSGSVACEDCGKGYLIP